LWREVLNEALSKWLSDNGWKASLNFEVECRDSTKRQEESSTATFTGTLEGEDAPTVAPMVDPKVRSLFASPPSNDTDPVEVTSLEVTEGEAVVDDGGLSGGAVAGIVIGVLIGTAIVIAVAYFVFVKKNSEYESA